MRIHSNLQDLLGRDPIKVNLDEILNFISGKVVMVTGGGGSIGSELCRQIAKSNPKQLIIFDIYENNAYAAGPASYGMTDTMGRMHSDAQFAGSSSVPAHVEMMGLIGMGNNPMVGASVDVAVAVAQAMAK